MFLVNLFPYFARNNPVFYSWLGALAIDKLGVENVVLIGTKLQLLPPSQQMHDSWISDQVKSISDEKWAAAKKIIIPDEIEKENYDFAGDGYSYLINISTMPYENYTRFVVQQVKKLKFAKKIIGISFANDASFAEICRKLKCEVIYTEGGPVRRPNFDFGTYYFDFNGINGSHSFDLIYERARQEIERGAFLSLQSILNTLYPNLSEDMSSTSPEFEMGVAMQVEDDSNLVVYSNGMSPLRLLFKTLWVFPRSLILVRQHPLAKFHLKSEEFGILDSSESAYSFLLKCKRLITINSSVAFESILLGKDTYVVGGSPLNAFTPNDIKRDLAYRKPNNLEVEIFVNIFLFCYLIPEWFWLDKDYYEWRLTHPDISEIFHKNLQSYYDRGYFLT